MTTAVTQLKHIDTRYFYVREQVQNGQQNLEYIRSEDNQADLLTKNLPRDRMKQLREALNQRRENTS